MNQNKTFFSILCVAAILGAVRFARSQEITQGIEVGVTKIIAGTNVTIDPATGDGDVTINASGGASGGTTLPLPSGSSTYIENRTTLQSGATFFVSSGTAVNLYRDGKLVAIADDVAASTSSTAFIFTSVSAATSTMRLEVNDLHASTQPIVNLIATSTSDKATISFVNVSTSDKATVAFVNLSTADKATVLFVNTSTANKLDTTASTQTKIGGLILGGAISASSASFVSIGATTGSFVLVTFTTGLVSPAYSEGKVFYDFTEKTLAYYNEEPDVTMNIGQELWRRVFNNSGATILNGDLVYQNGIASGLPSIALAIASDVFKADVLGFATHDIENNTTGYVTVAGTIHGLNTAAVAVSSGSALYLSAFTLGKSTQTRPSLPSFTVEVGKVEMIGSVDGEIGASIGSKMGGAITAGRIPFGTSSGFSSESSSLTVSTNSILTLNVLGNIVASSANFTNLFSNGSQVLDVSGSTQTKTGGLNLSGALEFLGVPYFRVDPNGNIRLGRGQGAFSGSRLMVLTDNGATLGGTGSDYLILGPQSLDSTSLNGQYCTFGGTGQMSGPSTGTYNMFWSNQGGNLRMGSGNSFFGSQINNGYSVDGPVGNSNNHMTNCTIIGNLAGGSKTGHDLSDSIAIGAGSLVGDSYTAVIGTPRTKVVIGTDIASSKFDVVDGSITVRGANSNIIATSMTATIFLTTSAAPATSQVVVYARNTRAVTTNVLSSVTLTDVTRGSQFVTGSTPTVVKIPWTGWYQIIAGGFRCGQGDGTVEMIGWNNAALTVRERAVVSDVDCTTFYKTFTKYLAAGTTSIYRVNENTSTVVIPEISTTVKVTADFTMIYLPQIPW